MPCPPLTLRAVKAAPLTSDELDENFTILSDFTNTLEVLVNEILRRHQPTAYYAASTAGTDSYEITISPAPTLIADLIGVLIAVLPDVGNTDAAALTVNGLAAQQIVKTNGATALTTGDITANKIFLVIYDGTNFQLQQ